MRPRCAGPCVESRSAKNQRSPSNSTSCSAIGRLIRVPSGAVVRTQRSARPPAAPRPCASRLSSCPRTAPVTRSSHTGAGRVAVVRLTHAAWPELPERAAARRPAGVGRAARPPPAAGHRHRRSPAPSPRRRRRRPGRRAARPGAGLRRQRRARGLPRHDLDRHRGADRAAGRVRPLRLPLGRPGADRQRARRQPRRPARGRRRCCAPRAGTSPGSRAGSRAATRTPGAPRRH